MYETIYNIKKLISALEIKFKKQQKIVFQPAPKNKYYRY